MVKRLTSAQVMISWFVSLRPALGSVLTAQSLEPVSDSVSLSLPLPLHGSCSVSLCPKINLKKNKKNPQGHLGGSVGWASHSSSGHDLMDCEFKPTLGLELTYKKNYHNGNASWCSHSGIQYGGSSKIKNRTTLRPSNCTTRHLSTGYRCAVSKGHMHPQVYSSTINNSQSMERAQMSISG